MEAIEYPEHEVSIVVICEECGFLSEDLTACSSCGYETMRPCSDSVEMSSPENVVKLKSSRKREINPYGMFLKEQKNNLKKANSEQKLNLDAVLKKWKNLKQEERVKYKEMSIEDKKCTAQKMKKTKKIKPDILKEQKRIKNTKSKATERRKKKSIELDVQNLKPLLSIMIAEKKSALVALDKEITGCKGEIHNLSQELLVSKKMVKFKIEKLNVIKKEYKKLFASQKNSP